MDYVGIAYILYPATDIGYKLSERGSFSVTQGVVSPSKDVYQDGLSAPVKQVEGGRSRSP